MNIFKNGFNGLLAAMLCLPAMCLQAREYHVMPTGADHQPGTVEKPLRTINAAAQLALPGDTVTVHAGVYREWVNPLNGGESDSRRILYRAAEGEKVELKGSEVVDNWEKVKKQPGVWKAVVPNSLFGDFNPFAEELKGDWFWGQGRIHHLAEVYLNDVSLYEVVSLEKVLKPDTIRSSACHGEGNRCTFALAADGQIEFFYLDVDARDERKCL